MSGESAAEVSRAPDAGGGTEAESPREPAAPWSGIDLSSALEWSIKGGAVAGGGLLFLYCVMHGLPLRGEWDELLALFAQWAIAGLAAALIWTLVSLWPGLAVGVMRADEMRSWTNDQRFAALWRANLTFACTALAVFAAVLISWWADRSGWFVAIALWHVLVGGAVLLTPPVVFSSAAFIALPRRLRRWFEHRARWLMIAALLFEIAGVAMLIIWKIVWPDWVITVMTTVSLPVLLLTIAVGIPFWAVRRKTEQRLARSSGEILVLVGGGLLFQLAFLLWLSVVGISPAEAAALMGMFLAGVLLNGFLSIASASSLREWRKAVGGFWIGTALAGLFLVGLISIKALPPLVNWCAMITRVGNYHVSELWLTDEALKKLQPRNKPPIAVQLAEPVLRNVKVLWSVGDSWIVEVPGTRGTPVRLQLKEEDLQSPAPSRWPARR